MADLEEHVSYSNLNEHQEENEEDDGIIEYLEIDNEVMDSLQDPNGYFAEVNQSHPTQIYVRQSAANTPQLSLVIQNQSTLNEYTSLKQISSDHLDDENEVTNITWSNNVLSPDDNKAHVITQNLRKSFNNQENGKTNRKRKRSRRHSQNNDQEYFNQNDVIPVNKELIQSESDSLDLFFQSMAQTVLHLPPQIQAKIKMDICKVISMAEIKYCTQRTNSHNNSISDFSPHN